jgi:hypothetical protein
VRAAASRSVLTPTSFYTLKNSFIRGVRPLCRYYTQKIPRTRQCKASPEQRLSAQAKRQILGGGKICLFAYGDNPISKQSK